MGFCEASTSELFNSILSGIQPKARNVAMPLIVSMK